MTTRLVVKGELGDLEVPESLTKGFMAAWEGYEGGEMCESFDDFVVNSGFLFQLLGECEGKIVDKEMAIFLRDFDTSLLVDGMGRPGGRELSFEEGRVRYTILAFGRSDDRCQLNLHMIGYKEEV